MLRGDEWKEKRAEITPAFTQNRVSHDIVQKFLIRNFYIFFNIR